MTETQKDKLQVEAMRDQSWMEADELGDEIEAVVQRGHIMECDMQVAMMALYLVGGEIMYRRALRDDIDNDRS